MWVCEREKERLFSRSYPSFITPHHDYTRNEKDLHAMPSHLIPISFHLFSPEREEKKKKKRP
jgi:hypothetical protein